MSWHELGQLAAATPAWPVALGASVLAALLWRQTRCRQRAERDVRRVEIGSLALAQAVAHSTEAVVATDLTRRITWVNEAFIRMSGYPAAEALGRSPGALLQCEQTDPAAVAAMRAALDQGQPHACLIVNRARDGRVYWVELRIQPVRDTDGQLLGFISFQFDVTERQRAEIEQRENQKLLARAGRLGNIGGWSLDVASRRVLWSDQTRRLLDAEPDFNPTLADCVRVVARPARRQVLRLLRQGDDGGTGQWDQELPLRTRRGRAIWVRVLVELERGAHGAYRVTGALQDITVRRALKAELKRRADLLRAAFEAVDEAFALFDPDDRLVFCNEQYLSLYDASRRFIVPGARFEDIIRQGAYAGQYEAAVGREEEWVQARLSAHRAASHTQVQRLGNGRILRVVDRKTPDGHTVGLRVDITDLVQATEKAERADRAKSDFIATISHELRTPLQAITGFSDLGRHFAAGDGRYEPMFVDIHDAGLRMLRLVNGLLDVSKIDGSLGALTLHRAELWPLVAAVLRELKPLALAREVRFVLHGDDVVLTAEVDSFRLQQVVRNVLANALRFAPVGSAIDLRGHDLGGDGVELLVDDSGPGIPAAELDSIFEPFVQSTRTRDGSGGTGLGLAICRRIMGSHGGRISAENRPQGGARLRIWLPPAMRAEPAAPAVAGPRRLLRSSIARQAQADAVAPPAPTPAAGVATPAPPAGTARTDASIYIEPSDHTNPRAEPAEAATAPT